MGTIELRMKIKNFLIELHSQSDNKMVSVREMSFGEMFKNAGVPVAYRQTILEILALEHLLIIEGERSLTKYKWVSSVYNMDTLLDKIFGQIEKNKSLPKIKIVKDFPKIVKPKVIKKEIIKNRFGLDDFGFFMFENKIVKVNILGMWFNHDKTKTTYRVTDEKELIEEIEGNKLFHSITDLIDNLKTTMH